MNNSSSPYPDRAPGLEGLLAMLLLLASGSLVAFKLFITTRLNINWDEFWYLSFVHALARNEMTLLLQGAYTHLFAWLPSVAATEPGQIVAARVVMVVLLAITAALSWDLARRYASGFAAAVAPLVYLGLIPVVAHGGSFRADSMLAPLLMGALALLARSQGSSRHEAAAGALLGLAAAITVKVLLFAPMVACFVAALATERSGDPTHHRARGMIRSWIVVAGATLLTMLLALGWHAFLIADALPFAGSPVPAESISQFASRTSATALLHSDWFPLGSLVSMYAQWQPLPWLLMGLGFIAALFQRCFALAALGLALLPVIFYRNTFPYFYVVMMAPVAVLAAQAVSSISGYVASKASRTVHGLLLGAITVGLVYQCFAYLGRYALDTQFVQRQTIAGVHEIFPEPVNYVDRCGMISSFRKVGPFLSSWGMTAYRDRGVPVFTQAIGAARPAFVLMNSPALGMERPRSGGLLEPDAQILRDGYLWYWGPIRVAGGAANFDATQEAKISVPFPAAYRIEAEIPLLIDGVEHRHGDVVHVDRPIVIRAFDPPSEAGRTVTVHLFLAAAGPRPPHQPIPEPIFTGL